MRNLAVRKWREGPDIQTKAQRIPQFTRYIGCILSSCWNVCPSVWLPICRQNLSALFLKKLFVWFQSNLVVFGNKFKQVNLLFDVCLNVPTAATIWYLFSGRPCSAWHWCLLQCITACWESKSQNEYIKYLACAFFHVEVCSRWQVAWIYPGSITLAQCSLMYWWVNWHAETMTTQSFSPPGCPLVQKHGYCYHVWSVKYLKLSDKYAIIKLIGLFLSWLPKYW